MRHRILLPVLQRIKNFIFVAWLYYILAQWCIRTTWGLARLSISNDWCRLIRRLEVCMSRKNSGFIFSVWKKWDFNQEVVSFMPVCGPGRWSTNHPYKDSALSINNAQTPTWSRLFMIAVVRLQESFPPVTLSFWLGDRVVWKGCSILIWQAGFGFYKWVSILALSRCMYNICASIVYI